MPAKKRATARRPPARRPTRSAARPRLLRLTRRGRDAVKPSSPLRAPGSAPSSAPHTRRSSTFARSASICMPSGNPASFAVSHARRRGLKSTRANCWLPGRARGGRDDSPLSVSRQVRHAVCWPLKAPAVSPCRSVTREGACVSLACAPTNDPTRIADDRSPHRPVTGPRPPPENAPVRVAARASSSAAAAPSERATLRRREPQPTGARAPWDPRPDEQSRLAVAHDLGQRARRVVTAGSRRPAPSSTRGRSRRILERGGREDVDGAQDLDSLVSR